MLVSGLLSAAVPTDALTSWLQSQGITSAVTTLPRPWVTWTKGLAGRTRVLQPVKEGTVQLSIQSAIADERGRQLLWVSRHDHTLCSPHLSTQACYQKIAVLHGSCQGFAACNPCLKRGMSIFLSYASQPMPGLVTPGMPLLRQDCFQSLVTMPQRGCQGRKPDVKERCAGRTRGMRLEGSVAWVASSMMTILYLYVCSRSSSPAPAHVAQTTCANDLTVMPCPHMCRSSGCRVAP